MQSVVLNPIVTHRHLDLHGEVENPAGSAGEPKTFPKPQSCQRAQYSTDHFEEDHGTGVA